jgi:hypothetical protein
MSVSMPRGAGSTRRISERSSSAGSRSGRSQLNVASVRRRSDIGCAASGSKLDARATHCERGGNPARSCASVGSTGGQRFGGWAGKARTAAGLRSGEGEPPTPTRKGDSRGRSRRRMCVLRLQPVRRRAPLPPPRAHRQTLPVRGARAHAVACRPSARGREVRATVRKLPRRGRGGACCCRSLRGTHGPG